ncbi:hypothetical protein IEU95_01710 [Hoyosella rhizosphaerae]|uniref:Secreted protein n=1 Tax=Hoyosella rhizosphaerae TaxID=1755582 RepID=A0A916XGD8_9ACTN|nr:hypothetical protein [Hoyosella rhizosphaerae]MBN4925531.1 hypothetical protein [Hoyosella rhizosphaerae]GGC69912.1 hypothetical protein GCM10011410_23440 [Hoyosella rhizosphaerae]
MRLIARTTFVAAVAVPLTLVAPGLVSAAEPTDVSYAFEVSGSTVSNTITNDSGSVLVCTTSLAPAPDGVLPPVEEVMRGGQTLFASGEVHPGGATQTVTEVPDGTYVVLASCATTDGEPAMWVSDYPGVEEVLQAFPATAFTVQDASQIVTVPSAPTPPAPAVPDLLSLLGSGSAEQAVPWLQP